MVSIIQNKKIVNQLTQLKGSQKLKDLNDIFSPKKQIQRLKDEDYFKDIRKIEELEIKNDTNIFRIIKSRSIENKISDSYGWLLNPSESHFFDENFLRRFLKKVFEKNERKTFSNYIFELDKAKVKLRHSTEKGEPDFIITIPKDNGNRLGFVLESKFGSDEGKNQLRNYREFANNNFEDRLLVFLTINGRKPKYEAKDKKNEWVQISHKDMLGLMRKELEEPISKGRNIDNETKNLVKKFVDYLEWKLMNKKVKDKCRNLWEDDDYKAGLEKIVEYRLRERFGKLLKEALKAEDWYSDNDWKFGMGKSPTLAKKKWNPLRRSRIFFKVNPMNPKEGTIAVKIHHSCVTRENGGFMSEDEHKKFEEKIIENKPEDFNDPNSTFMYIRAFYYEEFKPENYPFLLDWTVEKLRQLNDKCSEIIDNAIERAENEEI